MTGPSSRRAILGAFAAAAVVPATIGLASPGATTAESPDAALLALHGPLLAAWAVEKRLLTSDADEEYEAATDVTGAIVERVVLLPAKTLAGLKVKALACSWCHCGEAFADDSFNEQATTDVRLASSILRDLLAMEVQA